MPRPLLLGIKPVVDGRYDVLSAGVERSWSFSTIERAARSEAGNSTQECRNSNIQLTNRGDVDGCVKWSPPEGAGLRRPRQAPPPAPTALSDLDLDRLAVAAEPVSF
ncbi:hypothetical protein J6590_048214 [Homalodisca vitripennis]|nr:hypothetical protein J6590_048214 [Homalodisca vitripennis]